MAPATLFDGVLFWVSLKCPARNALVTDIKDHGGSIVVLESRADIKIVDHLKKENPPNSYSYTFIEKSISNGVLEDKENHRAPTKTTTVRPVGSLGPAKIGKQPYTHADDEFLRQWVQDHVRRGEKEHGNTIYQNLEEQNPRHPWQSWRDRWIKYVRHNPPSIQRTSRAVRTPEVSSATLATEERGQVRDEIQVQRQGQVQDKRTEEDPGHNQEPQSEQEQEQEPEPELEPEPKPEQIVTRERGDRGGQDNSLRFPSSTPSLAQDESRFETALLSSHRDSPIIRERANHVDAVEGQRASIIKPLQQHEGNLSEKYSANPKDALGSPTILVRTPSNRAPQELHSEGQLQNASVTGSPVSSIVTSRGKTIATTPLPAQNHAIAKQATGSHYTSPTSPVNPVTADPKSRRVTYSPTSQEREISQVSREDLTAAPTIFTEQERQLLFDAAKTIQGLPVPRYQKVWAQFAGENPSHSANEWRKFYEEEIVPIVENQELMSSSEDEMRFNTPPSRRNQSPELHERDRSTDLVLKTSRTEVQPLSTPKDSGTPSKLTSKRRKRPNSSPSIIGNGGTTTTPPLRTQTTRAVTPDQADFSIYIDDELDHGIETAHTYNNQENSHKRPRRASNRFRDTGEALSAFTDEPTTFHLEPNIDNERPDFATVSKDSLERTVPTNLTGSAVSENADSGEEDLHLNRDYIPSIPQVTEYLTDDESTSLGSPRSESIASKGDENKSSYVHWPGSSSLVPQAPGAESQLPLLASTMHDGERRDAEYVESLSESGSTQRLRHDFIETQDLELDVPSPGDLSEEEEQDREEAEETLVVYENEQESSGQTVPSGISNMATQDVGFASPKSNEDLNELGGVEVTDDYESPKQSTCTADALHDFIDAYIELGFTNEQVILALERTSLNSELARDVLYSVAENRGVPRGIRGIWTEEDDEILRGDDSIAMRVLEKLHGTDLYNQRLEIVHQFMTP